MATVPRYDNFQASPTAPSNATFQAPSGPNAAQVMGQQMQEAGGAVSRAGSEVNKIMLAEQERISQTLLDNAMSQAVGAETGLRIEAMKTKGRDALDRPDGKSLMDEYDEKLKKNLADISGTLKTDAQKQAFTHQTLQLRDRFTQVLGTHVVQQQGQFEADTDAATAEVAVQRGGMLWGDAYAREQAKGALLSVVANTARRNGWSPTKDAALIEAATTRALTPLHTAVLKGMIESDHTDEARAYYEANSAQMSLQARVLAHDAIQAGDFEKRTQAGAEDVLATAGGDTGKALTLAREKFSGKEEDAVVQRLKALDAERSALDAREAKRIGTEAWTAVMENGRVPPTLLAVLRQKAPEEERQIRDWQEAKWRRAKADAEGKAETNFYVFYGLRMMAANDPGAFAQLDLRKFQPYVKEGYLTHLAELQGSLSRGDAKAMESQRVLKTTLGIIKSEVSAAGIDLTPKEGSPAAQETAKFMGALTIALDEATRAKAAPLTGDEAKRIGMGMVREGVEQGSGIFGFFGTKKRGYQIATDPDIKPGTSFVAARFSDIPAQVRDALTADYRTRKGLGTRALSSSDEAEIERAYTKGVHQGRF